MRLGEARRHRRVEREIRDIVSERFRRRIETECAEKLRELTNEVVGRRVDPYEAADRLIQSLDES